MTPFFKLSWAIITLIALAGCSTPYGDEKLPIANPSVTPPGMTDEEYNFTQELSDRASRYVSDGLTLRYDSCGIMVTRTSNSIRFVDLNGENDVIISSKEPFREGDITATTTLIENGQSLPIKSIKTEQLTASSIYLNILTGSDRRIIVAVTDL